MNRAFGGVLLLCGLALVAGAVAAARWVGTEYVLSSCTTALAQRSEAQRTNISTARARLDGRVLLPDASFSFNETVGRRCVEAGYEMAPGYAWGGTLDTRGGGICQLSSTLYGAALQAGLRIDERAAHVQRVRSIGIGRDAAVVYGRSDLRFTNPYAFPVKLHARVAGARLVVEISGSQPLPQPVEVRVEESRVPRGTEARTWRRIGTCDRQVSDDVYLDPVEPPASVRR